MSGVCCCYRCGATDKIEENDICAFGICYGNGWTAVIMAQFLLLAAFVLGSFSVLDCQFIQVQSYEIDPYLQKISSEYMWNLTEQDSTRRGLGFFFFEGDGGQCQFSYVEQKSVHQQQFDFDDDLRFDDLDEYTRYTDDDELAIEIYLELFGDEWHYGQFGAGIACLFELIVWVWVMFLACSVEKRIFRYFLAFVAIAIITPGQALTFRVFHSNLCVETLEHGCKMGGSAWCAVYAVICSFAGGLALLFTKNYGTADAHTRNLARRQRESQVELATVRAVHSPPGMNAAAEAQEVSVDQEMFNNDLLFHTSVPEIIPCDMVLDGVGDAQEVPVSPTAIDPSLLVNKPN